MTKLILGFTGQMAAGKGAAAGYLAEKYDASTYTFSTMLRDALERFYLDISRDNLIKLSEFIRSTFGEDTLARTMSLDVELGEHDLIVIEGIRRTADVAYLREMPGFVLVRIEAPMDIRYARLRKRAEKEDDMTKSFEAFKRDHERSTEVSIAQIAGEATEIIDNSGSFDALHQALDGLISKYR